MCDWDAVKELGAYLGLDIDDALVEKLATGPESGRALETICGSAAAFEEIYGPDNVGLIMNAIFQTDFSLMPSDSGEALSRDVFRRISGQVIKGEGAYDDAFANFDLLFRRFIRWFRAALTAALCVRGHKKEEICLDNAGIRHYLAELRELPCRRPSELSFSGRMQGSTALARYVQAHLKEYEGTVIPEENCRSIVEIMNRVSAYPGYYKAMDAGQRLVEVRPLLLAISELQLDPGKGPVKAGLLSALSILLFNVFPSAKLLKLVSKLRPDEENDELAYEYYAILSMNHLLAGRLDEAAAYNEKALEHATGEEKRAYTHILDSCIRLHRRDFNAAIDALYRCSSMTKDRRMRSTALFYLGIIYYETGSVAEARECFEMAGPGFDDDLDAMNVCNNIGTCDMVRGDLPAALKAFGRVEHLGRYMSSNTAKRLKAVALANLGIIHFSLADYDRAMDYFRETLKLDRDTHHKKGVADQLGNLGLALKHKKDYKLALDFFRSALNVSFIDDYAEGALFAFSQVEQLMALEGRYGEAERLKQDMIRQNPDIARRLKK